MSDESVNTPLDDDEDDPFILVLSDINGQPIAGFRKSSGMTSNELSAMILGYKYGLDAVKPILPEGTIPEIDVIDRSPLETPEDLLQSIELTEDYRRVLNDQDEDGYVEHS
jgi:hypothetical protein